MVTVIFESHGTTLDNETGLSSGWYDVDLSPLGEQQSRELGERYRNQLPDAVFCSDHKRSWRSAELAFGNKGVAIMRDARLRECDYGKLTRRPTAEVDLVKGQHVSVPFPGGKSYQDMADGMREFLRELLVRYAGKRVMVIGSRATQYSLEHWINGVPLAQAVAAPWQWQPGWTYRLNTLA